MSSFGSKLGWFDAAGGYSVLYSCRFNRADSPSLTRTPGATSTAIKQKFVIAGWLKKGINGATGCIAGAGTGAGQFGFQMYGDDTFRLYINNGTDGILQSTAVFRDNTAYGHFCLAVDTTQATASNRVRLWWNNVQLTLTGTTATLNAQCAWNDTVVNRIGADTTPSYFDGYLAQVINLTNTMITDPITDNLLALDVYGNIIAKDVTTLSRGTNGFMLDSSNSSALGEDQGSGTNDFTSSGLASNDQVTDTPTNNSCTLNPLVTPATTTILDGNLVMSGYTAVSSVWGSVGVSSGKWYWEITAKAASGTMAGVGKTPLGSNYPGGASDSYAWDGTSKYNNGSSSAYGSGGFTTNDVIGVALDLNAGTLALYKNNTSPGTMYSSLSGTFFPIFRNSDGGNAVVNFGQSAFTYTPPTGFSALCTANLPAPASAASVTPKTGSFTGNGAADGPFVWLGYTPNEAGTCTINGNTVTWGTHARSTAGGFKIITTSASYNNSGVSNTYSIAVSQPFGGSGVSPAPAR